MTAKLDGTNGLIQQYDYQTPTTGFSYTFAAGTTVLVMNPAGTLATGTITMPASPADGMTITFESTQQITALTVQGNTGQSLVNGTLTLRPNQPVAYVYRLSNTTWYPYAGASNSQLISGTAVASTSGTSIDFTSIPSWVKRITVMFNNVSTNGTSNLQIQLGSGSPTTSGYQASSVSATSSGNTVALSTTGFVINAGSAAYLFCGQAIFSNLSGNYWTGSLTLGQSDSARVATCYGSIGLAGVLDRIRITTVNGTDTFDAGTINILYE